MAKFKPSTVSWWVSVYKQEPSEKRSKEERHVICEDLYLRAGLHKPTAGSAPVRVHVRVRVHAHAHVHALPS